MSPALSDHRADHQATRLLTRAIVVVLTTVLLLTVLVSGTTSEADAKPSSPCPDWDIPDMWADPNGNWDGDLVSNRDEIFNLLDPCKADTADFCANGVEPICNYPTNAAYPIACANAITATPNGDYDLDGVSNSVERANFTSPCVRPCPHPNSVDVALNPNGDWDYDGVSNRQEIVNGTNPCRTNNYNPCPHYSRSDVNRMPGLDWDYDGISNAEELRRGLNPCQRNANTAPPHTPTKHTPTQHHPPATQHGNAHQHVTRHQTYTHSHAYSGAHTHPHQPQQQQLPHVATPAPKPTAVCPPGYPHFHAANGKCYANPIKPRYR